MMGRTHMAIGFLTGVLTFPFFSINPFLYVSLVTFASLLPDVDHENSKINRMVPLTRWIPKLFRHRGFFHSIFPVLIIYFGLQFAGYWSIGLALAVGYLSHLVSDCFTRLGCNLLHPVSTFRIQGFVFTGGMMEFVIFGLVMVANIALLARFIF